MRNENRRGVERNNLFIEIFNMALSDQDYKVQLIENPVETISNTLKRDIHFPVGKIVKVEDQSDPSVIYLNIPSIPDLDEIPLTEEQLEQVAGGITTPVCVATVCAVIGYGVCYLIDKAND